MVSAKVKKCKPIFFSFYPIPPFPTGFFAEFFMNLTFFLHLFLQQKELPRVKWFRNSKYVSIIFLILKSSFSELLRPYSAKQKINKIVVFAQFLSDLSFQIQLFFAEFFMNLTFFFLAAKRTLLPSSWVASEWPFSCHQKLTLTVVKVSMGVG